MGVSWDSPWAGQKRWFNFLCVIWLCFLETNKRIMRFLCLTFCFVCYDQEVVISQNRLSTSIFYFKILIFNFWIEKEDSPRTDREALSFGSPENHKGLKDEVYWCRIMDITWKVLNVVFILWSCLILHFLFELIEAINRSKESCFCLSCSCSYLATYLYMRLCYIFEEMWYSNFVLKQNELSEPNILFF